MEALEGPNIDYRGVTTKDGVRGLAATDASFKKGVELCASSKLEEVQLLGDDLSQGTATCAGSSAGDSYIVTFKVEATESGWHTTASCSCPAAANVKPGQICKHSAALLLRRVNEINKRRSSGAMRTDGNARKGKLQSLNTWVEPSLSKRVADSAEPPPISKLAEDGPGLSTDDPARVSIPKPCQSENASPRTTIAPGRRMLPSWMTKEVAPLPKTKRKGSKAAAEGDDDLQDGSESKKCRARGAAKRALTARPPAPRKRKAVGGFKIDSDSSEDDLDASPSSTSRQAGRQQARDEEAAVHGSRRIQEENMENSSVLSIIDEKVGGRVQKAAAAAVGRRGVFNQNQQRPFEDEEGGKDVQKKRNRRRVHRVEEEDDGERQAAEEKEKEKENESNASSENGRERTRRDGLRHSKGLGKARGRRNEVKKSRKTRGRNDDDDEDWLDDNRQGENVRDASDDDNDDGFGFSSEDLLRYAQERLGQQQGGTQEEVLPLAGKQTCRQGAAEEKPMSASDKGEVKRSKETANVSDARRKPVSLWERLQSTQAPSLRFNLNQVLEDADRMRKSKEEMKNKDVTALDKAATIGLHPCVLGRTSGRGGGPSLRATGGLADGPDGEPASQEWDRSENSGVSVDARNPFPSEMRVGEEEKYHRLSDDVAADPDDIKHKVVKGDGTEDGGPPGGRLGHLWGPDKLENSDNENDDDLLGIFLPGYRRSRKTKGVDANATRVGVDADGGRSMQVHTQTRSSPPRTLETKARNIEQQDLPFSRSILMAHTSNFSERTKESLFEDVAGNKGVGYTGQAMGVMRHGQASSSSGLGNEEGRYDGGSYSFNRDGLGHSSDELRMGSGSDTSCVQNLVGVPSIATSDTGPQKAKEAPNDSSQPQKKSSLKERLMKLGIGSSV
ncbi:hypothetical protein CBR_g3461 [Chara braunii]|uniref:SWIM-type domain-containing protein n=1 Tax=Chara braunii TaxID=69332 RepID=A0A388JR15_CHABU|nr:hypothetical protein CBR_g3461 [Chara braunii]|eukprot:GBG60217.1 hypothetical protein CBR_g3461 [Chara braunii]